MYKTIALAGTFDRLHKGHRFFISEAFKHGEKVVIGLTSDRYVSSKFKVQSSKLQSKAQRWEIRKQELEKYLQGERLLDRAEIIEINNMYGPAIEKNSGIEALAVTTETFKGGEEVNRRREESGLGLLELVVVGMVPAEDNERISSTRIREGEIDRWGHLYRSKIKNQKSKINEELRIQLKRPQGKLIPGDINNLEKIVPKLQKEIKRINPLMIITVGDEVTRIANKNGLTPKLSIFDFKVNRKEKYGSCGELGVRRQESEIKEAENPAGSITKELVEAVGEAYIKIKDQKSKIKDMEIIKISGEDDLAAVPAIMLAPLGAVVIYGQPGEGVVVVEVTEEKKEKMYNLLATSE